MSKGLKISLVTALVLVGLLSAIFYALKIQFDFSAKQAAGDAGSSSLSTAETWILHESPTYLFDGFDLRLEASDPLLCLGCYQFIFSFYSRQAGLGDQSGQVLAQVITPHKITVSVIGGKLTSAVTDGIYDELTGQFLLRE